MRVNGIPARKCGKSGTMELLNFRHDEIRFTLCREALISSCEMHYEDGIGTRQERFCTLSYPTDIKKLLFYVRTAYSRLVETLRTYQ